MTQNLSIQCSDVILSRLMSLHPKVIDLTLDRVARLLEKLGNPQRNLPPVIHVSGTNGKGSVIALMSSVLAVAGKRIHAYTSPHLIWFRERIRLAGNLISEEELAILLEECETVNGGDAITFFEITTCAAFLAFARSPADVLLLETGLGGRLDATNIVGQPALTVITEISFDHQQYLGNTIEKIAFEKAGIMKKGVPCVLARQIPEAEAVILERAEELNIPIFREGVNWNIEPLGSGFRLRKDGNDHYLPRPGLFGEHQLHNAGVAVQALENCENFDISGHQIARGLQMAYWPGRLQYLRSGPLIDMLPEDWELWVDGGHNESAAVVLGNELRSWLIKCDDRPIHLIIGMLNSKDPSAFLIPFKKLVSSIVAIEIPGQENSLSALELARAAKDVGYDVSTAIDAKTAINMIINNADRVSRILICGSLYLAGNILSENS